MTMTLEYPRYYCHMLVHVEMSVVPRGYGVVQQYGTASVLQENMIRL